MSREYDLYLAEHIANVQKGWDWMREHLLPEIDQWIQVQYPDNPIIDIYGIQGLVTEHDRSKYDSCEYNAYDAYFYGPPATRKSSKTVQEFNAAFLRHIHKNPHHWQYWVLVHDDPDEKFEAIEMPLIYIFEMICDWWTFSWKANDLLEIFQWYKDHKEHMILHPKTKKTVEYILWVMEKTLDEWADEKTEEKPEELISHTDISDKEKEDKKKFGLPDLKKYPMPDPDHVKSAIRFFNYVDPKHEKELAEAILERMKEYDMSFEDFGVGDENRFKNYIPKADQ